MFRFAVYAQESWYTISETVLGDIAGPITQSTTAALVTIAALSSLLLVLSVAFNVMQIMHVIRMKAQQGNAETAFKIIVIVIVVINTN